MKEIVYKSEYFSPKDTLECGQVFRFKKLENGDYFVISKDKACILKEDDNNTIITVENGDEDYFYNYFDLERDYSKIFNDAINSGIDVLEKSARLGKGVRILNQDKREMMISFLISQNNNIPRIKKIISNLSENLGENKMFNGENYFTFPSAEKFFEKDEEFYKQMGLGYRASYINNLKAIKDDGYIENLSLLSGAELKNELIKIKGIGEKVADCICLFGFHHTDSFPVDTWIEKIYKEDFHGELTNRNKITAYFVDKFKENSGYFQQYLFYFKRSLEKLN